jgi:hypothetical protein
MCGVVVSGTAMREFSEGKRKKCRWGTGFELIEVRNARTKNSPMKSMMYVFSWTYLCYASPTGPPRIVLRTQLDSGFLQKHRGIDLSRALVHPSELRKLCVCRFSLSNDGEVQDLRGSCDRHHAIHACQGNIPELISTVFFSYHF